MSNNSIMVWLIIIEVRVPNHANRRNLVNHRISLPNDWNSDISPKPYQRKKTNSHRTIAIER